MTPAQQAQIDQCRRMRAEGATRETMQNLGFANAAINVAMRDFDEGGNYGECNGPIAERAAQ